MQTYLWDADVQKKKTATDQMHAFTRTHTHTYTRRTGQRRTTDGRPVCTTEIFETRHARKTTVRSLSRRRWPAVVCRGRNVACVRVQASLTRLTHGPQTDGPAA